MAATGRFWLGKAGALGAQERILGVVGEALAPRLKSAGFRRVGAAFVRKLPATVLSHVIQIDPSRTRPGTFSLTVAIASPLLQFLWTGRRDRNATGNWLEHWRADELTGDVRHREFHAEDPNASHDLARAAEKIAAALRREPYRQVIGILKRAKTPAKQAALLFHLGRVDEAATILERELARERDPSAREALASQQLRFMQAAPAAAESSQDVTSD